MASYNKVILMGNLTRDPELRYTPTGTAVCNMDIAVNSTSGYGETRKEETLFIRVVSFNKQAENCGQYLKKGNPVLVDGRLRISSWEGDDGQKRYRTEVMSNVVQFLSRSSDAVRSSDSVANDEVEISAIDLPEDDIPF
jgi:single-strand DNA-binding protein